MAVYESYNADDGTLPGWTLDQGVYTTASITEAAALGGSVRGIQFAYTANQHDVARYRKLLSRTYVDLYIQFRVRLPSDAAIRYGSGNLSILSIHQSDQYNPFGQIQLAYASSAFTIRSNLGSANAAFPVAADTRVEVHWHRSATAGGFRIWLNGTLAVDDLSYNQNVSDAGYVCIGNQAASEDWAASGAWFLDEIQIADSYIGVPAVAHSVTYAGNGNTGGTAPVDSGSYYLNDPVTIASNSGALTRTGYRFAGWNTAADGSGTTYSAGSTMTMPDNNVTLYARWLPVFHNQNVDAVFDGSLAVLQSDWAEIDPDNAITVGVTGQWADGSAVLRVDNNCGVNANGSIHKLLGSGVDAISGFLWMRSLNAGHVGDYPADAWSNPPADSILGDTAVSGHYGSGPHILEFMTGTTRLANLMDVVDVSTGLRCIQLRNGATDGLNRTNFAVHDATFYGIAFYIARGEQMRFRVCDINGNQLGSEVVSAAAIADNPITDIHLGRQVNGYNISFGGVSANNLYREMALDWTTPAESYPLSGIGDAEMAVTRSTEGEVIKLTAQDDVVEPAGWGSRIKINQIRVVGDASTVAGAAVELRCPPYGENDTVFEAVASGANFDKSYPRVKPLEVSAIKASVLGAHLKVYLE